MNNKNLVPLITIWNKIKSLNLLHYIYRLGYANDGKKKYYVILNDNKNKKIKFGNINYEDYLIHKNEKRRRNYRQRHKNDNINNINYPGFWSYHVLW